MAIKKFLYAIHIRNAHTHTLIHTYKVIVCNKLKKYIILCYECIQILAK